MANDLEHFSDTIQKLRYDFASPRLNAQISELEPHAKKSDVFLIKMEIKRLAQPVNRVLDLRNTVKSECEPVERAGVTHYMDSVALEDFDSEYKRYGGIYSIGVYEYVVDRVKNRGDEEHEKSAVDQLPNPKTLGLTDVFMRRDERLYFASKVRLMIEQPSEKDVSELAQMSIEGLSTDISESGLSVKVPAKTFIKRDAYYIQFVELEREFAFNKPVFVRYILKGTQNKQGFTYAMLTLDEAQPEEVLIPYGELLKACFHNYKRRNRVSVDNTVEAVQSKIYEQCVLGRLHSLPMYCDVKDGRLLVKTVLEAPDNLSLKTFLTHTSEGFMGDALLLTDAVKKHVDGTKKAVVGTFLLRFKDKQRQIGYAAIPYDDAMASGYLKQVLSKALSQGSAKLLWINFDPIDAVSTCHIPSSVPNSAGEAFENLNRLPHKALHEEVSKYHIQCVIYDMTETAGILSDIKQAQSDATAVSMRPYVLPQFKSARSPTVCRLEEQDQRQEDRFLTKLKVRVTTRASGNEIVREGMTESVSTRGLHIVFKEKHAFYESDVVFIDIQLPFTTSNRMLERQKYKIVGSTLFEIRVAISGNVAMHDARIELRKRIYENLDKLRAEGSTDPVYGLSRAVRHLYASNHPSLYGINVKQNKENFVHGIAISEQSTGLSLHKELGDEETRTLLSKNLDFRRIMYQTLADMDEETHTVHFHVIVVARRKRQASPIMVVVKGISDGFDYAKLRFLFSNMASLGEPRLLRIDVSTKGRFFDKYLRDEMRYLAKYARVKHDECINLAKSITSLFSITDATSLFYQPEKNT